MLGVGVLVGGGEDSTTLLKFTVGVCVGVGVEVDVGV
jgi:hypothetical protein